MPPTALLTVPVPSPTALNDLRATKPLVLELTDGVGDAERLRLARAFCSKVLGAYWEAMIATTGVPAAMVPCPVGARRLSPRQAALAVTWGADLVQLPRPLASYHLSALYTALLPEAHRAEFGVFFTPPALTDRLLDLIEANGLDWTTAQILDPAAGGGAFVSPVAVRMVQALEAAGNTPSAILAHLEAHLHGMELDAFSAWMSHVLLEVAIWETAQRAGRRLGPLVEAGDALDLVAARPAGWPTGFDLIVGNPPYGKVRLSPERRARFARSLYGHANLYGLFTDLAVHLAGPAGLIGFVTPASFLGGHYFQNLRHLLATEAPPSVIDFVADRSGVFEDVLQETVLAVFRRRERRRRVQVTLTRPAGLAGPREVTALGTFFRPFATHAPWILPRESEHVAVVRGAARMTQRLADCGVAVSTGPLVWNRHKEQLTTTGGAGRLPLIWAESVAPQGTFRFSATRKNHAPYFRLQAGQDHLQTTASCVLVQRTTAKEQNRRLIAAVLPEAFLATHGGAVVENHLNMVRPSGQPLTVGLATIAALLNSDPVDWIFRCVSGSVAVSAYELEYLPVPGPTVLRALERLVEAGADRVTINCFLADAYGATP